jgi:hypothetical protein
MIDVYELIRIKENELARVRQEIESLRIVAVLLSEPADAHVLQSNDDRGAAVVQFDAPVAKQNASQYERQPEPAEILFQSIAPKRRRFRDWLGRAAGE